MNITIRTNITHSSYLQTCFQTSLCFEARGSKFSNSHPSLDYVQHGKSRKKSFITHKITLYSQKPPLIFSFSNETRLRKLLDMVIMPGHIQLMIIGNIRSYLCYCKLLSNICNLEVHEEKWTKSLKSCHFPISSSSICTHEDNLLFHSGCLWCSSSSWSTCPPPPSRCLHPPTAAEKLHAFISLRWCSQAVTGNDTSPHPHSRQHGLLKTSPLLPSALSSPTLHRQPKSSAPCSALT